MIAYIHANTLYENIEFIDEQMSYSTRDVERIEFFGELGEYYSEDVQPREHLIQVRLIGSELFNVSPSQPPKSVPLTKEAGIFKIIGLGGEVQARL